MLRAAVVLLVLGTLCAPQLAFAVDTATQKFPPIPVGGDGIWAEGAHSFTEWAANLPPLIAGAVLLFNFSAPYDVVEVLSQGELNTCDLRYARPAKEFKDVGPIPEGEPYLVSLSVPGTQYFTTTKPGACAAGVKFAINVDRNPYFLSHYIVGSGDAFTLGKWTIIPPFVQPLLQQWADSVTVQQGDVLEFVFPIPPNPLSKHSLEMIPTAAELDTCDFSRGLELVADTNSGVGRIVRYFYRVSRTGPHHFACDVGDHCAVRKQKFTINVAPHPMRGFNVHWVGGEASDNMWAPNGTNYQWWADSVQVHWSDILTFRSLASAPYSVAILPDQAAFESCDFSSAMPVSAPQIEEVRSDACEESGFEGEACKLSVISVSALYPGPLYLANQEHCASGMKLMVTVGDIPVVGSTDVALIGGGEQVAKLNLRTANTNLGNLIADTYAYAGSILTPSPVRLAVFNSGGIGPGVPAGPLRTMDAYAAFRYPFDTFAVKALNGSEIRAMFDVSAAGFMSGPFLQISSAFHVTQAVTPQGIAVLDVQYFDEHGMLCPFDPDEYYNVATNSYIAEGNDGYWMFRDKPNLASTELLDAMSLISPDIFAIGWLMRDPAVPLDPLESRYTTLGIFLAVKQLAPIFEAAAIAQYPQFKRYILHALKEYSYADSDPSFFSADLSQVTADDGKGQRFYSAIDDCLNALSRMRTPQRTIVPEALGFMWSTLAKMQEFTVIALQKAKAMGCDDDDDMNIAWKKYSEGLSRVVSRPADVLDKWRDAYRISTECVLRGPRRLLLQSSRKLLRL